MVGLAVVIVDAEEVAVWPRPAAPVQADLSQLGLVPGGEPGSFVGGWWLLEPVCSVLDRHGYRWAADTAHAPRMWAERLFAETPPHLADGLYDALRAVLDGPGGDRDHLAVVEWAWRHRHRDDPRRTGTAGVERLR